MRRNLLLLFAALFMALSVSAESFTIEFKGLVDYPDQNPTIGDMDYSLIKRIIKDSSKKYVIDTDDNKNENIEYYGYDCLLKIGKSNKAGSLKLMLADEYRVYATKIILRLKCSDQNDPYAKINVNEVSQELKLTGGFADYEFVMNEELVSYISIKGDSQYEPSI